MDAKAIARKALGHMASLPLGLGLFGALLVLFLAGALQMPSGAGYESINSVSLLKWMAESPLAITWWLWGSVACIALLAVNTLACMAEAALDMMGGASRATFNSRLGVLLIHASFLFMAAAHLISSLGAINASAVLRQDTGAMLPDGSYMYIHRVTADVSAEGYISDWSAEVEFFDPKGVSDGRAMTRPNTPAFYRGQGLYLKMAQQGMGLFEVHREPGAAAALIGGVLFSIGTVVLTAIKIRRDQ